MDEDLRDLYSQQANELREDRDELDYQISELEDND
jgi:hypothetical protein